MRELACAIVAVFVCASLCVDLAAHATPQDDGIQLYKDRKFAPPSDADFGLLGFKFAIHANRPVTIFEVYPGTPAAAVDLRKGDCVLQVDGVITNNLKRDELYGLLRGQPDTIVELTIRRGDSEFVRSLKRMHSKDFAKAHPDLWKDYSLVR